MEANKWKNIFTICNNVLGAGNCLSANSDSWCAWTTFSSLEEGVFYWQSGIPDKKDIQDDHISQGIWTQPFLYNSLAHLIIPKTFYWEIVSQTSFENGYKNQDIGELAKKLDKNNIPFMVSKYWLEVRFF